MQELISSILKEKELHQKALQLAEKRFQMIKDNKIAEMQEVVKEEEKIIGEIVKAENIRIQLLGGDSQSLKEIAEKLPDENQKNSLLKLREELIEIIKQIKVVNERSEKLINVSNRAINVMLQKFMEKQELGYNKNLEKNKVSARNLLNKKV